MRFSIAPEPVCAGIIKVCRVDRTLGPWPFQLTGCELINMYGEQMKKCFFRNLLNVNCSLQKQSKSQPQIQDQVLQPPATAEPHSQSELWLRPGI